MQVVPHCYATNQFQNHILNFTCYPTSAGCFLKRFHTAFTTFFLSVLPCSYVLLIYLSSILFHTCICYLCFTFILIIHHLMSVFIGKTVEIKITFLNILTFHNVMLSSTHIKTTLFLHSLYYRIRWALTFEKANQGHTLSIFD